MAARHFAPPEAPAASRAFYRALLDAAQQRDAHAAERITREVMEESITFWQRSSQENQGRAGDLLLNAEDLEV